jgi:cell division protein FtsI/penicillin-binding protein 2
MSHSYKKKYNLRLRWLTYVFIPLIALVILTNLFHIQVQNGTRFREQADNQYVTASYNAFERGNIYFQDKNGDRVTAAGQKSGYKLAVDPTRITEPEVFFETVNEIIPIEDSDRFMDKLLSNRTYEELVTEITVDDAKKLKDALGSRIQLYSEKWRVYPLETAAAHTVGFMAYDQDDYEGRYGLERYYEDTLVRTDKNLYTNFFARVFHGVQDLVDTSTVPEGDITTSIEPQVQIYLETQLKAIQDRWDSEAVGGIIIHPQTGSIYALGALPSFNPNDFTSESIQRFRNPLVENVYEFGSVVKPLVVASAWDNNTIDETFSYYDSGSVIVGPHTIYNFDRKGRGYVDVQDILTQSLNTGMVQISLDMSKDDFRSAFKRYGFGQVTGIDLPNEEDGLIANLQSNRDIEFANMSFGQGIAVSPMAMTKAMTVLANNGMTSVPHLVTSISYENGLTKNIDYTDQGVQVISPETSAKVSQMLVNVFDEYNDGRTMIPNYSVAAKTGTAQIPAPDGGYYEGRNLHSFVGYFPAYDPEFLIFLYTVYPKEVRFASETLLMPFRETVQYLINYYNVPPDR